MKDVRHLAVEGKKILVCSRCLGDIAETEAEGGFDIYDCSWECPHCNRLWLSSDSITIMGNVWLFIRCSNELLNEEWIMI